MSKIVSLLILSAFIFNIGIKTFPIIEYVIDYDNISTNLCENKDKPDLGCNGKCYLFKKSRKLQESEDEKKATIAEKLSLEYTTIAEFKYSLNQFSFAEIGSNFEYIIKYYPIISKRVLAPPKLHIHIW